MDINEQQKNRRNIVMADSGLLFVALFWGGGFVAGKFALEDMSPMNIMAYRYVGATLVMALFCLKKFKLMTKKMIPCAILIGFLMYLGNTLQTIGLQYTTPGKQSFIISLYTVLVPLLSWIILKTKPSKRIIVAAFIALAGIALLTLKDDFTIGLGDFLTFLFAVAFSLQVVFIGIFMKDMDATLFTFLEIAAAAVFSLITALLFDTPASLSNMHLAPLLGLAYLVTFNTAFAFLLQNLCQRFAPANHTAILLSTETVFGTIFAVTLANEVFRGRMILGCVLMFAAIIISELPAKKQCAGD
ncbi:DMT family transporter [Anaerovorax odorimutans]|uniref:DMT family transporter n=1 Tax=Anaerovorax odorimutans TaxID=109327 RepID=A0ABT1RKN8_9FIRM|nr:DMT family transporter [Anaerovorax odorimutans]MCQ4635749.1 DMT family transporter [Anaerovorax odorimutans]